MSTVKSSVPETEEWPQFLAVGTEQGPAGTQCTAGLLSIVFNVTNDSLLVRQRTLTYFALSIVLTTTSLNEAGLD